MPEFEQNLNIIAEEFTCGPGNRPLYRASFTAKETQSCDEIYWILSQWVMNGEGSVVVQGNRLSIANFCEVRFDSFVDAIVCNEPTTDPPRTERPSATVPVSQSGSNLSAQDMVGIAAGIAGLIVLVVIIASIVFIVIVLVAVWKSKRKK